MENTSTDLVFNGQKIRYIFINDEIYLDVNAICAAIGVDVDVEVAYAKAKYHLVENAFIEDMFIDHSGNLNNVTLLSQMLCFGWVMNIKGQNQQDRLKAHECHKAIWNFFH